jgi:hypothetical protein
MGRKDFFQWISVVATVVLGAMLRLHALDGQSYWRDESATRLMAYRSDLHLFEMQAPGENIPPPYFVIMNGWMKVFGTSDASLRMPSALCGIAAVVVMYLFGSRLARDPSTGFVIGSFAALLLATSRFHIAYSQEARPYSLAFLLGLISCHALATLLTTRRLLVQWLYFFATAAMFWTHPYTLFLFVAQCAFIGFCAAIGALRPTGIPLRRWATLMAAVVICISPWMNTANLLSHGGQAWMPKPDRREIIELFVGSTSSCVLFALLSICALIYAWKRKDTGPILGWLIAILPIAVPVLLSQGRHSLFIPRYGIVALIGLYISAAFGAALFGTIVGSAMILLLFFTAAPDLYSDFQAGVNLQHKADIRGTIQQIESLSAPGDAVWCPWDWVFMTVQDYLSDSHIPALQNPNQATKAALPPKTLWLILNRTSDSREFETTRAIKIVGKNPYRVEQLWMRDGTVLAKLARDPPTTSQPGDDARSSHGGD